MYQIYSHIYFTYDIYLDVKCINIYINITISYTSHISYRSKISYINHVFHIYIYVSYHIYIYVYISYVYH